MGCVLLYAFLRPSTFFVGSCSWSWAKQELLRVHAVGRCTGFSPPRHRPALHYQRNISVTHALKADVRARFAGFAGLI
jgi:hypothetical protein